MPYDAIPAGLPAPLRDELTDTSTELTAGVVVDVGAGDELADGRVLIPTGSLRERHEVGCELRLLGRIIAASRTTTRRGAALVDEHGAGHGPALVDLADDVVVGELDVVEELLAEVFAAADLLDRLHGHPGRSTPHREPRETTVLRDVPVGAGQAHAVVAKAAPVLQIFAPLRIQRSPSRSARVRTPARSEPAPGSEKNCTQISSPESIFGMWRRLKSARGVREHRPRARHVDATGASRIARGHSSRNACSCAGVSPWPPTPSASVMPANPASNAACWRSR